ncbi:MAG: SpoIIE family protein phosphatase [Armatimonadota bacterium]|nr:SpoIIE family protein phosphatase [Armatimonadota bacterium]
MSVPLRVLIVEDSEDDALIVALELRHGGYDPAFERVETRDGLESALDRQEWDIVLADYRLPGFSGLDALKVVRDRDPEIPFIIVSGQITEETAVEAMKGGAQDYVLKDNLARLSPAVDRELREMQTRREREAMERQLRHSQELFAKAFRSGPQIMAITVLDTGECIEVNEAFVEAMGFTCDEVVGQTVFDLDIWLDVSQRERLVSALAGGEQVRNWEVRFRTRHGELLTGLLSAEALEVDGQRRLLTIVNDITDRKKAEEALEEALAREQRFSLLLQRALLPSEPTAGPGYDVAAEYVPVYSSQEIGGDFYDVFRLGECRVGVLIGDVSGKGLEAAAMAAATRSTIHAFVHESASAGEALQRANSVLCSDEDKLDSFVTVFLVIIDACSGEISYSSAGHPPAAICRADGDVEFLECGQLPLALQDPLPFEERRDNLEPGDKLVLYTDGIIEARNGLELLDFAGLQRTLTANARLPASELARAIVGAATDWSGGKLADDAAVVIVERQG